MSSSPFSSASVPMPLSAGNQRPRAWSLLAILTVFCHSPYVSSPSPERSRIWGLGQNELVSWKAQTSWHASATVVPWLKRKTLVEAPTSIWGDKRSATAKKALARGRAARTTHTQTPPPNKKTRPSRPQGAPANKKGPQEFAREQAQPIAIGKVAGWKRILLAQCLLEAREEQNNSAETKTARSWHKSNLPHGPNQDTPHKQAQSIKLTFSDRACAILLVREPALSE
jgi:hypothetical protein